MPGKKLSDNKNGEERATAICPEVVTGTTLRQFVPVLPALFSGKTPCVEGTVKNITTTHASCASLPANHVPI